MTDETRSDKAGRRQQAGADASVDMHADLETGTASDELPAPLGAQTPVPTTGGIPQTLVSGAGRTTARSGIDGIDGAQADISSDVDADRAASPDSAAERIAQAGIARAGIAQAGDQQPRTPRPR